VWFFWGVGFLGGCTPQKTHRVFLGMYPGVWTLSVAMQLTIIRSLWDLDTFVSISFTI